MVTTVNSLWLPSELQREVFSFCDSHTLAVACLLSRDLLDDSRDILYHTVKISDIGAARMVSNASQLIPRIRHLHAIITGAGGHNASWISLLTILKNANVIGTLNLIPPPILSFRTTPEIVASIDELSQVSSVHTFMAVWPDVEVASQFGWTFSSLALWGGRLKGLHIRDFRRYHERPEILGIKQDKPVLDALELGQYIHPAPTSFQIHKVRKLAVMLGNHDFHEDKIRDILKHMVQTLELFVFSWFGNYERGQPASPPHRNTNSLFIFRSHFPKTRSSIDLVNHHCYFFFHRRSHHSVYPAVPPRNIIPRSQPSNCQALPRF
ncbi:hypothetical protein DL96DRAFT_1625304 [Flagelloscypha sp. PMI_526]|nr:hypothetical protein DL96DRAFT_1625304 [Flagelloscypha sp. PMI_526]